MRNENRIDRRTSRKTRKAPKRRTKKEIKENFENSWSQFFRSIEDNEVNNIEIYKKEDFFLDDLSFETNKIHVFQGDNGQGKSTLLRDIIDSTSMNIAHLIRNRLKMLSNSKDIGSSLNDYQYSPYKMEGMFFYGEDNLSNLKNNITFYSDFSVDFYKHDAETAHEAIQVLDRHSNGERKISGINDIFQILSVLKNLNESEIIDHLNIIVVMDEPESGLSMDIQKEFRKKCMFYLGKMNKNISLTFFIASHSFVWTNNDKIDVHDINEFKKENSKLIHKRVFV